MEIVWWREFNNMENVNQTDRWRNLVETEIVYGIVVEEGEIWKVDFSLLEKRGENGRIGNLQP